METPSTRVKIQNTKHIDGMTEGRGHREITPEREEMGAVG
jgi:hypothetical protein